MASRIALAFTNAALALSIALPVWGASSINTTQPANGVPYSPSPIRLNFGAAAADINALLSNSAGTSAPSNPSPGQWWLDTTGITAYELKIWDGRGNAWLHVATLDTINNIWIPPVGGGLLPTILSASTTDIGSVPQASLNISGSNSIQAFGSSAPIGAIKILIFTGSPTLVNVPGQLSLPNSVDVTQQAGDVAIALQVSQGSWKVLFNSRAAGPAQTRTILTATQNLYVATTGADTSNNCTNNLAPCQTIQHAVNQAIITYDLAGQSLLINVANGTYSAGATVSGPLVGSATSSTNPSVEFPLSGLQIIGNPSNPSAVVIADTTSPGFVPAAFASSAGAVYAVSGFTVSSVNGYGLISQSGALIQWANMVFGNTGAGQVEAHVGGVANAFGNYTIAGSATQHLAAINGGVIRITPQVPITISLSGTPTFSFAFAAASRAAQIITNSITVTISGAATGRRFYADTGSTISTGAGTETFFPGTINGALLSYASYLPPLQITSVSAFTGAGVGAVAGINSSTNAYDNVGSLTFTSGSSGTAATGTITFLNLTHEWRICTVTLGTANWAPGATVSFTGSLSGQDQTTFTWYNNGIVLPTGTSPFNIDYACTGAHI